MRRIENPKIGDIKTLKKEVGFHSLVLEQGDQVEIIGLGDSGYDVKEVNSGEKVLECGWDIFEE